MKQLIDNIYYSTTFHWKGNFLVARRIIRQISGMNENVTCLLYKLWESEHMFVFSTKMTKKKSAIRLKTKKTNKVNANIHVRTSTYVHIHGDITVSADIGSEMKLKLCSPVLLLFSVFTVWFFNVHIAREYVYWSDGGIGADNTE